MPSRSQSPGGYRPENVDAILGAIDRMARLIDDLADVVRLESGELPLRRQPVDLVALKRTHKLHVDAPEGPVLGE